MKRLMMLLVAAMLLVSLCGCASVFEKEYFSAADYQDTDTESGVSGDGASEIKNYFGLKVAISGLVSAHAESGTLDFRRYNGSINDDIAAACKEVSTSTALGSYCVDYISYDLDRIVSYYEARIYVSYKRTAQETESMLRCSTTTDLYAKLKTAMSELKSPVVIMVNAASANERDAAAFVEQICREEPLQCPYRPVATVNVYSGSGVQKIYEFEIDYGGERAKLLPMRQQVTAQAEELAGAVTTELGEYIALQCASALITRCESDPEGGATAYAALVDGRADSEGMAMAYAAVCRTAGVSCRVVEGRLDKEEHFWNIIGINGAYYHVDLSRAMSLGLGNTFLLSDSLMWGSYWWDTELYPACEGTLTYRSLVKG